VQGSGLWSSPRRNFQKNRQRLAVSTDSSQSVCGRHVIMDGCTALPGTAPLLLVAFFTQLAADLRASHTLIATLADRRTR
jgi:hypothetical protein